MKAFVLDRYGSKVALRAGELSQTRRCRRMTFSFRYTPLA